MATRILVALLLAGSFVGCSDPKEASESNFKAVIESGFKGTAICQYGKFPVTETEGNITSGSFPSTLLTAFTNHGLVTTREEIVEQKSLYVGGGTRKVKTIIYELSDEGKKFYRPDAIRGWMGTSPGFCFGSRLVQSISRYTEPADVRGYRASQVDFAYKVINIPDWATDPDVVNSIHDLKDGGDKTLTGKAVLVLTNKGWELAK